MAEDSWSRKITNHFHTRHITINLQVEHLLLVRSVDAIIAVAVDLPWLLGQRKPTKYSFRRYRSLKPTMRFSVTLIVLATSIQTATSFVVSSSSPRPFVVPLRISAQEDLELTRQILMGKLQSETSDDDDKQEQPDTPKTYYQPAVSDRPQNDLMMRAAVGQAVEQTPLWLFRQAGRHLPEYQAYKKDTNKNFLELLADPACVAECTLQPIRRYPVDAAILFSDILVIAEALGVQVTMPGGVGIQVPEPLKEPSDVTKRLPAIDEITPTFVQERLGHVLTAVQEIRKQMQQENISIPLIGFSAAPWTLLFYMVGGSSKRNKEIGVQWLENHPTESQQLLDLLTKVVIEYMSAQVEKGAHMLQIFEAMGMMIDDANFERFALPCLAQLGQTLKERFPDTPLMVFCRGACHMNDKVAALGYFDVVTIDGSVDRSTVREFVGPNVSLQGNYDPRELIPDGSKTPETVRQSAKEMLQALGPERLIANLGEGLGGKEDPALVQAFVDAIHEESAAMIAAKATKQEALTEN